MDWFAGDREASTKDLSLFRRTNRFAHNCSDRGSGDKDIQPVRAAGRISLPVPLGGDSQNVPFNGRIVF